MYLSTLSSIICLIGDFFQIILPVSALWKAFSDYNNCPQNHPSKKERFKSFVRCAIKVITMIVSVFLFKEFFRDTWLGLRPNGHRSSFPSGHTASAMTGGLILDQQYGYANSLPIYGMVLFTAFSRVHGQYHHVRDVIAGTFLSLAIDRAMEGVVEHPYANMIFNRYDDKKNQETPQANESFVQASSQLRLITI